MRNGKSVSSVGKLQGDLVKALQDARIKDSISRISELAKAAKSSSRQVPIDERLSMELKVCRDDIEIYKTALHDSHFALQAEQNLRRELETELMILKGTPQSHSDDGSVEIENIMERFSSDGSDKCWEEIVLGGSSPLQYPTREPVTSTSSDLSHDGHAQTAGSFNDMEILNLRHELSEKDRELREFQELAHLRISQIEQLMDAQIQVAHEASINEIETLKVRAGRVGLFFSLIIFFSQKENSQLRDQVAQLLAAQVCLF